MGLAGKIKQDPTMSSNLSSATTQNSQMMQTSSPQTNQQWSQSTQPPPQQFSQAHSMYPPQHQYAQGQMQPAQQYQQTQYSPQSHYGNQGGYGNQVGYGNQQAGYSSQSPHYSNQGGYSQSTGNNIQALQQKLQTIVQQNGLESFYDANRLNEVLQKVSLIDFDQIAQQWKIPKELAYDLAPLALYDIVFYCDDSGSMIFDEGGERVEDLKFILSRVADIGTRFDDDGIVIRFMNCNVNGDGVRNAVDVQNLMSKVKFSGITPLGTNLDKKVIQPFVLGQANSNSMAKPILTFVITDGEPTGEPRDTLCQIVKRTKNALSRTRYGSGAFALQVAQVGKDLKALKFLEQLDNDPVVGNVIDCTSYFELEAEEFAKKGVNLTPDLWLLKMCVGSIDPSYDAMD